MRKLDQEEDVKNPENAHVLENVSGRITFNNFSFMYPDASTTSLEGVSFEIQPGEIVGIVGKIGSGKTTLVNSLLTFFSISLTISLLKAQNNTFFSLDNKLSTCINVDVFPCSSCCFNH